MSWTLLLFATPPPDDLRDWQLASMGSPQGVRETLNGVLEGVVWDGDGWGQFGDESCQLEFQPFLEDPVVCVAVKVRGLGAPATLRRVAQEGGWCVVDGSSMEVIEAEPPAA